MSCIWFLRFRVFVALEVLSIFFVLPNNKLVTFLQDFRWMCKGEFVGNLCSDSLVVRFGKHACSQLDTRLACGHVANALCIIYG